MKRLPREKAMEYEFNKDTPPVFHVEPVESFVIETEDAASGYVRSADTLSTPENRPTMKYTPPKSNPVGGPVYVEGVEPGDLLVVNIEKIIPDEQGFTITRPGSGPLGDSVKWAEATELYTHIFEHRPGPSGTTRDGKCVSTDKVSWDLQPFVGTIGTAPEREVESSIVGQGAWGGNLDCRDIKEGTKVYLNSYNLGGLLFAGDVHGSQGDTEFSGTANETRAELTLSCNIVKNKRIPFIRLEKQDSIVSVFSAKPLEDAVESAIIDVMDWMVTEYGVSKREAYIHASCNSDFKVNIYQMVKLGRLQFTAGAEIPKKYLL